MAEPVQVKLTQLVLWYDATRVNAWPEFLTGISDDERVDSPVDFGRRHATDRMTDARHAAAEKIARNLPGLEAQRDGGVILRGVGLLRRHQDGYGLSPYGRTLRDQYRAKDRKWIATLASLFIDYEPRTRGLLRAIGTSENGLELFDGPTTMRWSRSYMNVNGAILRPFSGKAEDQKVFRGYIDQLASWSMGAWRHDELLADREITGLRGSLGECWSMHDIGLAFRASIEVFLAAGCLSNVDGALRVNHGAALSALGEFRCSDLCWVAPSKEAPDVLSLIRSHCVRLHSPTGHIVASELLAALAEDGIRDSEKAIAALEAAGSLMVYDTDYGQSRHGRGLYGDPRRQLIKIRFHIPEGHS